MRQPERQKLCSRTPMAVKVGTSCCIRGPESMRLVAVEVLSEALRRKDAQAVEISLPLCPP
jgi:hypothetical protein